MKPCSQCGKPVDRPATSGRAPRYCLNCSNAYMREWRKTHPLDEEQRRKQRCRAHTRILVLRGKLARRPCLICGVEPAQAHHPDYGNPRLVVWLCPEHHKAHHDRLRAA